MIKLNRQTGILALANFILITYIVLGNAFVYRIGGSLSLKLSEMVSIPVIAIYCLIKRKKTLQWHEKMILIWITISSVSAVIGWIAFDYETSTFMNGITYPIRILLLIYTVHFIGYAYKKNGLSYDNLIDYILKLYVVLCIIGTFQYMFYPVAYDWYNMFWSIGTYKYPVDPHRYRMISTYMDPNFLAACLLTPFALALERFQQGKKKYLVYLIVYAVSIVMTVSRSGILGLAIICIIMLFKIQMNRKTLIINFILILLMAAAVTLMLSRNTRIVDRILNISSDASAMARFNSWTYTIGMFRESPFIGIGYHMYEAFARSSHYFYSSVESGSDSSLILILVSSGIVGTLFFFYFLVGSIRRLTRGKMNIKRDGMVYVAVIASAVVITNFNNLLFYVFWLLPLLACLRMRGQTTS